MASYGVRDFTAGPIYKQLIRLAMPIMATNFIQMAYTLTDMAWIGRLGSEEVAAIGAVGILMWLTHSFALLTKIGAEISIAQSIGGKNMGDARQYASHNVMISLVIGIFFALILLIGGKFIVSLFKMEQHISQMAVSYLYIVALALPMSYLANTFAGIYNGSGRSVIPFYLLTSGLLCNMILDPLLIFGIGPMKGWGVEGAAVATLLSHSFAVLLFVWQMKRQNGILNRFPFFVKPQKKYIFPILKLGAPIALMNCLFAMISFYIARIASIYGGHLGVMSQTTGSQIEGITWNTSNGFSTALGTFVAQNQTAGKGQRTAKAYKYTLLTLLSLGVVVTFAFYTFGEEIFGVFVPEEAARKAGGEYLQIMAICQIFMMLENTTLGMWNGYGKTIPPAIISIVFNLARIPLAFWLAPIYGISGVWIAITISAILKGIISFFWWKIYHNNLLKTFH
ncbi:MATE family efflux transporter [Bacteroidales bacterium OttesenSCG-928-A17]|nr:MATE family efflux transporter [Bacteroidales bacterium OttesenSCG-928-A17]